MDPAPGPQALAVRYMPMAQRAASLFVRRESDRDDLLGVAYLALVEAANRFDPSRGVAFPVYARPLIVGALIDHQRAAGRAAKLIPERLECLLALGEHGDPDCLHSSEPTADQAAELAESARHAAAMPLKQIAAAGGITIQAASRRRRKARDYLAEMDAEAVARRVAKAESN